MIDAPATIAALDVAAARVGLELLGWVCADPLAAVAEAGGLGITQWHFAEDRQVIWLAAELAGGRDRLSVFRLIRQALVAERYWDDTQIAGNYGSMLWGDRTLELLWSNYFPSLVAVARYARELDAIDRLRRDVIVTAGRVEAAAEAWNVQLESDEPWRQELSYGRTREIRVTVHG